MSTNGTTAGAATIPFNTNITGLINPAGDIDNYKFVITTAGTITISLSTLPKDYDLKLLNSAGTQVAISQNGSTTSETINYTAAPGTYYAQVYGFSSAFSATSCYTLKVQLGTATIIGNPETVSNAVLKLYPSPASQVINVSVLGQISDQATLSVMDVNGMQVMLEKVTRNIQQLNISKLPNGVYMLKVNNGGSNLYSKFVKQ